MTRILAVDAGNSTIKPISGGLAHRYPFSNILAPALQKRPVLSEEHERMDTLHFRVKSGALEKKEGIYVAGKLATTYTKVLREIPEGALKALNDQTLIMVILAAALDAVDQFKENDEGVIVARYALGTCLPLAEVRRGYKEQFQHRLESYEHEIQFLQTVGIENKKVRIVFEKVVIGVEGLNALLDLSTPDSPGKAPLKTDLMDKNVVLIDIGGGSSERGVFFKGNVDSNNSRGANNIGVNPYIDRIHERIDDKFGQKPKHRQYLIERIKQKNYKVKINGLEEPIKEMVEEEFESLSQVVFDDLIDNAWKNMDDLDETIVIGGGAICLQEPLQRRMKAAGYPVWFLDKDQMEESIWLNARGSFKMVQQTLVAEGSK